MAIHPLILPYCAFAGNWVMILTWIYLEISVCFRYNHIQTIGNLEEPGSLF